MRFIVLLLIAQIIAFSFGELSAQKTPQKGIHGYVVDLFGNPIADAEIELLLVEADKQIKVLTNEKGYFSFSQKFTGKFSGNVRARGFRMERFEGFVLEGDPKPLSVGLIVGSLSDLPGIVVEGFVGMNGKPVNNATVGIINIFNTSVRDVALTGSDGRYRLEIAEPGQYMIYAVVNCAKADASSLYLPSAIPRKRIARDFVLTGF